MPDPELGPRRRGDARAALIRTGIEALQSLTPADLVGAIGARELCRRAGLGSGAFFHHFPTLADYADAVVAHVYDAGRFTGREVASGGLNEIGVAPLPVTQTYAYHANELDRLTTDAEFRVRLGLWALGGEQADTAFGAFLSAVDDRIAPAAEALFASWGREARPPFEVPDIVAAHVALSQGGAIRRRVDPDLMTHEKFKRAATALTFTLLRLNGDAQTMDDRLSEINYYPRLAKQNATRRSRRNVTARVLESAAHCFGNRGYDKTTIAEIARAAGVSADTIYSHFGTKAALALALVDTQARDFFAAQPPPSSSSSRLAALRAQLVAVAEFAGAHPATTPVYLAALLGGAIDDSSPVRAPVCALSAAAVAADELPPDLDAAEFTDALLILTLRRVLTEPGLGAEETIARVWALLIDHAAAPPRRRLRR